MSAPVVVPGGPAEDLGAGRDVIVTGTLDRQLLAISTGRPRAWLLADLSGQPHETRVWPDRAIQHVHLTHPARGSATPSWPRPPSPGRPGHASCSPPSTGTGPGTPAAAFPLAISDLAQAARSTLSGRVDLMDMQLSVTLDDIIRAVGTKQPDILGICAAFGQHDLMIRLLDAVQGEGLTAARSTCGARTGVRLAVHRYKHVSITVSMPRMTENAGRTSAAHRVYAATKELILNGELPAGSLISEGEIADRVHMSRTPVREAFLRLEAEELLTLHPKRGAVVVPVPPGEAADVLELRQALEQTAAERIARNGLAAECEVGLRELIMRQRELAGAGDVSGFAAADEAFHRGIVEASGNRLAARFYATLGDRQRRMSVSALCPQPYRLHILADEHETLLGHLIAGASDAFAAALRVHLVATHGAPGAAGTER